MNAGQLFTPFNSSNKKYRFGGYEVVKTKPLPPPDLSKLEGAVTNDFVKECRSVDINKFQSM